LPKLDWCATESVSPVLPPALLDAPPLNLDSLLRYGLVAVFAALILTPFGLPIPEDVSLAAAGVLVANGHTPYWAAWLVGYFGVMGGDIIAYTMGRRVGLHPAGFISRLVGPEDITRIERFYRQYGAWAIVIARQFPGMRMPAFFFAGASGIPMTRFLAFDGAAALITTSVFTFLGFWFADRLDWLLETLQTFQRIGTVVLVVLVGLVVWRVVRRRLQRDPAPPTDAPEL
jgi:membrane protein DedA with SNARE-associated domain